MQSGPSRGVEMRKMICGLAVAAAILLTGARDARACGRGSGGGGGGLGTLILLTGAVDIGLTLWDLGSAGYSHHPSTAYGVFEVVVAAPQVALGFAGMRGSNDSFFAWYTLWMGLMTAHGVWTVATSHSGAPPPATSSRAPSLSLEQQKISGPMLSLGPTYVPLGNVGHPGIGLMGRF